MKAGRFAAGLRIAPAEAFGYQSFRNRTEVGPDRQGVQVNSRGRRQGRRARRARPGGASFRSPLAALIVALSLIVQLVAIPYHQARAAPEYADADIAAVAAGLKATFGDVAFLCVQADDNGAPAGHNRSGHCNDRCPLCRFLAQAATLVPPDVPALPALLHVDRRPISAAPQFGALDAFPAPANRARAPPLSV